MTKKECIKLELQDMLMLDKSGPIAFSVQTSGLDDDNLSQDGSGNSRNDAMGRRDKWSEDEW